MFIISACQDIVGARIKSSGEVQPIDRNGNSGSPQVTYQRVLNMLTNAKHINPYQRQGSGVGPFLADGMTANEYCKKNNYGNCLLVINNFGEVYFNSNDLSCSNGINYHNQYNNLNLPADCNTRFDSNFYISHDPRTKDAVCLNGGYSSSDLWNLYYVGFICAKTP